LLVAAGLFVVHSLVTRSSAVSVRSFFRFGLQPRRSLRAGFARFTGSNTGLTCGLVGFVLLPLPVSTFAVWFASRRWFTAVAAFALPAFALLRLQRMQTLPEQWTMRCGSPVLRSSFSCSLAAGLFVWTGFLLPNALYVWTGFGLFVWTVSR
jgi:hypothetical protein